MEQLDRNNVQLADFRVLLKVRAFILFEAFSLNS